MARAVEGNAEPALGVVPSPRTRSWDDVVPSVSLVIPTMNEAENLPHVLPRIPSWVSEVIIVDGHSTDGTPELAKELMPDAVILYQEARGKGDALSLGFREANGDIIAAIDADGSMDPAELLSYVGPLVAGADLVKGSRFVQGGGTVDMEAYRKAGNWGLIQTVKILFGGHYSDLCYGYFAFWREALVDLDPDVPGFEIETLINVRALQYSLNVAEVPSFEARRIHGTSNLRAFRDGWRILMTILRERRKGRRRAQPVE